MEQKPSKSRRAEPKRSSLSQSVTDFLKSPCLLDPKQKSYRAASARIQNDLTWLCSRVALNEVKSIEFMADLGAQIAEILERCRLVRPAMVDKVARKRSSWPVTLTWDLDSLSVIKARLKDLKLGEAVQVRPDKTRYAREDKQQKPIVFHCLRILEAEPQILAILSKLGAFAGSTDVIWSFAGRILSDPEREESEKRISKIRNQQKQSLRALAMLLKISTRPSYVASPEVMAVIKSARELTALSAKSQSDWFELIVELLLKMTCNELEENETLRAIGDSAGDVVVREHCHTTVITEFNAKKIKLRDDPGVNGAIRTRIKTRLGEALEEFVE